jgi:hypothetical protein
MTAPLAHKLTVAIDPASLDDLVDMGVSLYVFLGFQTSNRTAVPLVFQAESALAATMNVAWTESYMGFASQTLLADGADDPAKRTIDIASSTPARLGQTLTLTSTFELAPTSGGGAGALTFRNGGPTEVTGGLSYGDSLRPSCAARLVPRIDLVIAPLQLVYLMLSTSQFELGSWVSTTSANGLTVDMTGIGARTVTFDMTAPNAWREADSIWAQPVPPDRPLAEILRQIPKPNVARSGLRQL